MARTANTARGRLAALATATLLLAACGGSDGGPSTTDASPEVAAPEADDPTLDVALSEPREDSYYPQVGDPGVDALHYDLDLTWDPKARTLTGAETLVFRATADAETVRLDLGEPLEVSDLRVDGEPVEHTREGKDLLVDHPVEADRRYELTLDYTGTPEQVSVPTTRSDFSSTGWTITDAGETWTMQEPWGAYTWYAVNDHPSDKALYDFTLTVPSPWVGVANGELVDRTEDAGATTTTWHLAEPAASYLVTTAFGDLEMTEDSSSSGVPITYWTPRDEPETKTDLAVTPEAIDWLEEILGPYPFDTFGTVVVDSDSGMETQTMVTLGNTPYTLSSEVILHELAHQWYGDRVTPTDWSDMWMNEGMAMYLQGMWEADRAGTPVVDKMDEWAWGDNADRRSAGPPGAFRPEAFGSGNVYYGPALMYQELREQVGDEAFFAFVRAWPEARDNGNATRADYLAFIEEQTGAELDDFFDAWLLGRKTPPRD